MNTKGKNKVQFQKLISEKIIKGHPAIIYCNECFLETSNVVSFSQSFFTGHIVIETLNTIYEKESD